MMTSRNGEIFRGVLSQSFKGRDCGRARALIYFGVGGWVRGRLPPYYCMTMLRVARVSRIPKSESILFVAP